MRKFVIAALLVFATFITVGCSSAENENNEQTDAIGILTPDDALNDLIAALSFLGSTNDSKESVIISFNGMINGLYPVAASLSEGIVGVPADVTFEVAVAVGAFATTSQLVVDCLEDASVTSDCDSFIRSATSQSQELGAAIVELVPYSNMTAEEFIERIR